MPKIFAALLPLLMKKRSWLLIAVVAWLALPVLALFHDQVLFLKHNLNARAISSLDRERVRIEGDVNRLIAEMQAAIDEAEAFIQALQV